MANIAASIKDNADSSDFASLLNESLQNKKKFTGQVVNGKVVSIDGDTVIVDVGLKSEGRIALREFTKPGQDAELRTGDTVEVYVERMEDRDGYTQLSREKARREEVWVDLDKACEKKERVTGVIFARVKGGFTVDLGGAVAFLPGSQVDIRPVRDVSPLMGTPQPFMILKMDRMRGNIVVSRRAVLEESREEARGELMSQIREGQIVEGVVKNITDYGAFIDLGGIDGLLHVTDISWKRVNHPSEALQVGQNVRVQIIRYNEENQRISLGMKQLESDPWDEVARRFTPGQKLHGKITNITDYGAFVEIEPGIEGLVHVSEMSWTKKNVHPNRIVNPGDAVDVQVLDIDMDKRRISLGIKQTQENPWSQLGRSRKVGDELEGEIRNITEFGLFVGISDDIDGMVHLSDISWEDASEDVLKNFKKGDTVKVRILDIDADKERIGLGIKQLSEDPYGGKGPTAGASRSSGNVGGVAKGQVVTCTVTEVTSSGIEVTVGDVKGSIKRADLSRERSEQRPDRFAVGEKVDAKVLTTGKTLTLSIKQRELDEDKAAMAAFGSTESGASLGDILGAALGKPAAAGEADKGKKKSKKSEE
jgi:small subunit ribosomal protein S1